MKDGGSRIKVDLIIIGNPNSGKTSLIRRFIEGEASFSHFYTPTLGLSLEKKVIKMDGAEVTVCIWDTAGQEKFLSLTKNYFQKADGVIVVFDLTDRVTFERVDKFWIPEIKQKADERCPQILVGNKKDMYADRAVSFETASQTAQSLGIPYYQTSAKTGEAVEEAIECLVSKCLTNINKEQESSNSFGLQQPPPQNSGCAGSFKEFFSSIKGKFS